MWKNGRKTKTATGSAATVDDINYQNKDNFKHDFVNIEGFKEYNAEAVNANAHNAGVALNVSATPNNASYERDGALIDSNDSVKAFKDIIYIPNWSTEDFVNERFNALKYTYDSPYSDIATYFFKAFFNFGTGYGLLGGLVSDNGSDIRMENTALKFLVNNINGNRFSNYNDSHIEEGSSVSASTNSYTYVLKTKANNLIKFGKILNYIMVNCPWFITEISGLDDAVSYDLNEVYKSDKSITVNFREDAIDMRVSTLFNLYRDACFDIVNQREVIPENLRKFDMTIITFNAPLGGRTIDIDTSYQPPLYGYHSVTSAASTNGLNNDSKLESQLTFNAVILKNCEFDLTSLKTVPNSVNSGEGFTNIMSIQIKYERSYPFMINRELKTIIGGDIDIDSQSETETETEEETTDSSKKVRRKNRNKEKS